MGKRLITQRRGRGFGRYRSPRHLRFTTASHPRIREGNGTVVDIVHEPGRIAPLAKIKYADREGYMIAPDGMVVGQEVTFGRNPDNSWDAGSGRFSTLTAPSGYELVDKNATTFNFAQSLGGGRFGLSSIRDATPVPLSFAPGQSGTES